MRERRQFARYDVSRYPQIRAGTLNAPIGERLMTISIGGCGFWAPAEDCKFAAGEKVRVHLQCEGLHDDVIEVKGEVLYVLPHPFEAQIGRFYGIRFQEEVQELIAEMIDRLESEYQAGKIQMA